MKSADAPAVPRPAAWALVLAFTLIYTSWGTTYFAIQEGVKTLPPALFGGVRITSAGMLLLAYLRLRGESLRLSRHDALIAAIVGTVMFVVGNGLITVAEQTVASGVASVLVATTPLWIALAEMLWPHGQRLTVRGWIGILMGLFGVLVLLSPKLGEVAALQGDFGPLLVLGSAAGWAAGTVILRHSRREGSHLASAAYQMVLGGGGLTLIGLLTGEGQRLTADALTRDAVLAFFYLLIVGSLVGFLSYTWLLQHVSAPMVGTYAYVNPAVALLVGWLLGNEPVTGLLIGGLAVILAGVVLVRTGGAIKPADRSTDSSSRTGISPRTEPELRKSAG